MTKYQVLTWLRINKKYINITAIGRDAGIAPLRRIVNRNKDMYGNTYTLADKHVIPLTEIIESMINKKEGVPDVELIESNFTPNQQDVEDYQRIYESMDELINQAKLNIVHKIVSDMIGRELTPEETSAIVLKSRTLDTQTL